MKTCVLCEFFEPGPAMSGSCHLAPPVVQSNYDGSWRQRRPQVSSDERACFYFRTDQDVPAPIEIPSKERVA